MKKHKHIPLQGGHVTWHGNTLPTQDQMKALAKMAKLIKESSIKTKTSNSCSKK